MRWFFLILFLLVVTLLVGYGKRGDSFSSSPFMLFPDMDNQYKLKYQKPSQFFTDGIGGRKPVEGTVPMGYSLPKGAVSYNAVDPKGYTHSSSYYDTGTIEGFYGSGFPEEITIDDALLARGKQRYEIMCTPCHGESGNGLGIVTKYWAIPPTANLIDPRVSQMPEGQIYWTIANGKGLMGPYSGTINVSDRWAITAYVRVLQFASSAKYEGDVKELYDGIIEEMTQQQAAEGAAATEEAVSEE